MARPVTRPPDIDDSRYCGYHRRYEPLADFTSHERTCKDARYMYHIRRVYGLSEEGYKILLGDGVCRICRLRAAKYVDHCHKTGRPRGVLCQPCNTALGAFSEDPAVFARALEYLEESNED